MVISSLVARVLVPLFGDLNPSIPEHTYYIYHIKIQIFGNLEVPSLLNEPVTALIEIILPCP
jgi:hypothetical protein